MRTFLKKKSVQNSVEKIYLDSGFSLGGLKVFNFFGAFAFFFVDEPPAWKFCQLFTRFWRDS